MGGLTTAMFLFLIASGLSLVFGVMRVINFAHGSFYMLGAYLAWQGVHWLQPGRGGFWLATLFAATGVALLGAVVERLFFRSLYGREELYQLLFTYALVLILGDAAKFLWGVGQLSVSTPPVLSGSIEMFGTTQPLYNLFIMAIGPAIAFFGWLVLNHTGVGRMVRAAQMDREMLDALGANVGTIYTGMFVFSSFLAGLSGRAGHADPEHRAGDGRVDHRAGVHRRRDRRDGLVLGHVLGLGDLWPGAVLRHPDLSRVSRCFRCSR